jgi:8-amino-7-oxononanoate synthase
MGTLGKAYGSYGAYILASNEIIEFLLNRAKAVIYTTAPSLFDIALGHEALNFILKNTDFLKNRINSNLQVINDILGINSDSLIIPIEIADNKKVIEIQTQLKEKGYLVGAIRQPTVKSAIIRLIAKIDISTDELAKVCRLIKELK